MGRHERRIQLKKSVDAVARRGMDLKAPSGDQAWAVIAATRLLADILSTRSPARASQAARRAHEFFETSLAHNPSPHAIACAKGCAFCCHVSVAATAPEIFLVANTLRQKYRDRMDEVLTRVRAADARTRGLDSENRARQRIPCAMLENNVCRVYDSRPGACRGFTSTSRPACERSFHGENVPVSTPSVWRLLRHAHKQALWAGLAATGLPAERYDFHHGLLVALENTDAEASWLKGEAIFAGVATESEIPTEAAHNQKIIDTLVAGALGKDMR
jgi:Fe-S-cluster containining protein